MLSLKDYLFDENKFAALGKTRKFGLFKQLAVLLMLCLIIIPLISCIALISFYFHWITAILILACLSLFGFWTFICLKSNGPRADSLWKKAKKIAPVLEFIWISAFVFGLICWFGSIWFNFNFPKLKVMFPLASPKVTLVDNAGQIYCLSRFYNRLQVFDKQGRFLRGWFIDLPAGLFKIVQDKDNNIRVISSNKSFVFLFDKGGNFLKKLQRPTYGEQFYLGRTKDSLGNTYKTRSSFLFPQIVKITPTGEESVIIRQPFGHWLVTMPIPGFVFLMLLVFFQRLVSKHFRLL